MPKNGTTPTGGKQRGTKVVTGSTSTVKIGSNHRATQANGGVKKPNKPHL
jgi:hypothetical protein